MDFIRLVLRTPYKIRKNLKIVARTVDNSADLLIISLPFDREVAYGFVRSVADDFLKNIITLYLKHNFYGKRLNANGPLGTDVGGKFSPSEIYGKMLGVSDGTENQPDSA